MRSRPAHALWLLLAVACSPSVQKQERTEEPIGAEEEVTTWATTPLDAARTARLQKALEEAKTFAPPLRPRYAATMLANAEQGRVLRPLIDGLNLVQQSGVENAPLVLVQPFEKYAVADAWKRSCARGVKAIADIVVLPPEERAPVLYASCHLEKSGLVTKDEVKTADASALAVATLVHDRLKANDALGAEELEALRMLVIGSLEAFHDIVPVKDPDGEDAGVDAGEDGGAVPAPASGSAEPGAKERPSKPTGSASPSVAPPAVKPKAPAHKPASPAPSPALSTSRAP